MIFDYEEGDGSQFFTVYQYCQGDGEPLPGESINFVVVENHIRSLLPPKETYPASWKRWQENLNIVWPMDWISWGEVLGNDDTLPYDVPKLACSVCGGKCKTLIATCGGSGSKAIDENENKTMNEVAEWWKEPNPWIHNEGCELEKSDDPVSISFPTELPEVDIDLNQEIPKWGYGNQCKLGLPISEYEWRINGELRPAGANFHRKAPGGFSVNQTKSIVQAGNKLVHIAGPLGRALRLFQEVEFGKLKPQREFIAQNRQWVPHLSYEMEEIMRIGATANYQRPQPVAPRRRGLPYKGGKTLEILEKRWPDIQKGRMFICGTDCSGGEATQIEATPTTLVPTRNPDRSWSREKRVIADLRRINLYFENAEIYHVELPTMRDSAKRILSMKRKFPKLTRY